MVVLLLYYCYISICLIVDIDQYDRFHVVNKKQVHSSLGPHDLLFPIIFLYVVWSTVG